MTNAGVAPGPQGTTRGIVTHMPDKVIPFPPPPRVLEPAFVRRSRIIFSIGRRRLAFDFTSSVTDLSDAPGIVVPIGPVAAAKTIPQKAAKKPKAVPKVERSQL